MRMAQRPAAGAVTPSSGKRSAVAAEVKGGWDRSSWERRDLPVGSRPARSTSLAVPAARWGSSPSAQAAFRKAAARLRRQKGR